VTDGRGGAENAGVENSGVENAGVENVARRKTQTLYVKVFEEVSALVAQFAASCAVADFEVRFPSRLSGRRRHRLLVSLRADSDEKMQQDRSERIEWT